MMATTCRDVGLTGHGDQDGSPIFNFRSYGVTVNLSGFHLEAPSSILGGINLENLGPNDARPTYEWS
jgi:hypothetical protein